MRFDGDCWRAWRLVSRQKNYIAFSAHGDRLCELAFCLAPVSQLLQHTVSGWDYWSCKAECRPQAVLLELRHWLLLQIALHNAEDLLNSPAQTSEEKKFLEMLALIDAVVRKFGGEGKAAFDRLPNLPANLEEKWSACHVLQYRCNSTRTVFATSLEDYQRVKAQSPVVPLTLGRRPIGHDSLKIVSQGREHVPYEELFGNYQGRATGRLRS